MEPNRRARRLRRRDDTPPVAPKPAATLTVHDVPDHILELILLGLDSSVCLVRAASACKRWFRVVADAGFQARFRHAHLILGHYVSPRLDGEDPIFVPSPTRSGVHTRESMSLDFVPKIDGRWTIADSRHGLLLLRKMGATVQCRRFNPDLVVCNPLTRRYEAISCPPEAPSGPRSYLGLFLVQAGATGRPGSGRGVVSLSNFKVVAVTLRDHRMVHGRGVPEACVYSRRDGSWHDISCGWEGTIDVPNQIRAFFFAGRANGSLYWGTLSALAALVLHEATAGVSQIAVPGGMHDSYFFRVIGSEDGTLRTVRFLDNDVRVHARVLGGDEWVLQTRVPLPVDTKVSVGSAVVVAAHETYVLVSPRYSRWLFSVDLETMAVERVREWDIHYEDMAYPYELQWPPTLRSRTSY